ncbi:hypothetical protein BDF20DRAFT_916990 [Mycotypha africana]|uniref:uncharacterized protein n=1 Tax=Mycotypha africana TaxID=64632 RepID=UPI0023000825|nr:uncharacterized protein BDF20DRAFT_916990 [Mycotypha africana]KAI8968475.1 hypothetical protein BDF20DRAFT_916990 [Mycotypha africana]
MKSTYTVLVLAAFLVQWVSAQSTTACAAQNVLDTCLSNEDNYLKTCINADYACLCKWHTAKLSCYDNCPSSLGRPAQQGLKDTYCSIAQTYTNTTSAVSSIVAATATPVSSASASAALPSSSSSNQPTSTSDSPMNYGSQGLTMVASMWFAAVAAYYLFN